MNSRALLFMVGGLIGFAIGTSTSKTAVAEKMVTAGATRTGERPAARIAPCLTIAPAPSDLSSLDVSVSTPSNIALPPRDPATILGLLERAATGQCSLASLARMDWESIAPFLAEHRPTETLDLALRLPTGRIAQMLCVESLRSIAKTDAPLAWRELERLGPGNMEREATAAVLGVWAGANPHAAAQAVSALGFDNTDAWRSVAGAWARRDPQAAVAWASALPSEAREAALAEAVQHAMSDSSDANLSLLLSACRDETRRAEVASEIATSLMMEDEGKAYRWARTLPDPLRTAATNRLIKESANSSPEVAAGALTELLRGASPTDALDSALFTVAQSYASTDAAAAMNWACALPATYQREAINEAMLAWAARDPVRASEWLTRQPGTTATAHARLAFAAGIMSTDPRCAVQWLRACPASNERDQMLQAANQKLASAGQAGF